VALVVRGSAAARAGLEENDVILQINETAVVSRDAARDALADLAPEQPFKLTVRRGDQHLAIEVPPAVRR
jgi:S1-C subfamily serine protease